MHPTTNTHTNYTIIGTLLALIAGIILGHTLTLSTTLALTPNNPTTQGTQAVVHSYTDTAKHHRTKTDPSTTHTRNHPPKHRIRTIHHMPNHALQRNPRHLRNRPTTLSRREPSTVKLNKTPPQ